MNNNERLEEIKEAYRWAIENSIANRIADSDIEWLINYINELEEERDEWKNTAQSYYMTNHELREQNKRYKQALEEINRLGWDSESFGGGYNFEGEMHAQAIKIAYEALEGEV